MPTPCYPKGKNMTNEYEQYLHDKLMDSARKLGRIDGHIQSHRWGLIDQEKAISQIEKVIKEEEVSNGIAEKSIS